MLANASLLEQLAATFSAPMLMPNSIGVELIIHENRVDAALLGKVGALARLVAINTQSSGLVKDAPVGFLNLLIK